MPELVAQVSITIDNSYQAYLLSLLLADAAAEHERHAHEWNEGAGGFEQDEVYQALMRDAKWLRRIAKEVSKQVKGMRWEQPVEGV